MRVAQNKKHASVNQRLTLDDVISTLLDQCSKNEHDSHMIIFSTPFNYSKLCKWHVLCPKGVHLLNFHQPERYRTSKKSYNFLNKRRYTYLEFQYLAIEKNSSKLKKKKFFSIDSTNQTFIIYKNSQYYEQNLSDD